MSKVELTINERFRALIPPLQTAELTSLETSLQQEGCRDALVVWGDVLVDGHNRYALCQKHGIPFDTRNIEFQDEDEAAYWIICNQLGRRNLTDEQRTYFLGKKYEMEKGAHGGDRKSDEVRGSSAQSEPLKTADRIAQESNVSRETVKRAATYTQSIDAIAKNTGEETKAAILSGETKLSKKDVNAIAAQDADTQKAVIAKVKEGKTYTQATREHIKETAAPVEYPEGKYRVIYADPPWEYGNGQPEGTTRPDDHYPTMPISDICDMPIRDIATDNAVLFLWVPSPLVPEALEVAKAWGFKYKTAFVWDKVKHNMGYYNSVRHELLFVCTRGSCLPDKRQQFGSVVSIERTQHSEKPQRFREIIDTIYPNGPRIELFARGQVENWVGWGNEVGDDAA